MRPSPRLLSVILLALLSVAATWIALRFARGTMRTGGTGTLVVRVEDAETGSPLAGAAVRVFRERGGARILALGTTDAHGEARFEHVEANMLIAQALRAPPYAQTFGAAWLEGDETETIVLAATRGKTVRGRVVDYAGAPIAGAEIVLDDFCESHHRSAGIPAAGHVRVATSGADGRFEVLHLAPHPSGVTIEAGRMVVRDRYAQSVVVLFEDARVHVVDRGEKSTGLADVGDVVVPAASTWSGRVVDARGAPVAGALVSTREERGWGGDHRARADLEAGSWPDATGFRLLAGESITDAKGRFVVRGRERSRLVVWTSPGMLQALHAARLEPGERRDGIELRIDDAHLLVLELVDARGERVRGQLAILLRDPGGDTPRSIARDPDGLFRVQSLGLVRRASRARLEVPGYAPALIDVPREIDDPVRVVLEELPVLRVRVRFEDPRIDALDTRFLELDACVADPRDATRRVRLACCGLGAHEFLEVAAGAREFALPVLADRPYFVALREYDGPWTRTYGPWRPGAEVRELVVPELVRVDEEFASISARVTDARTGEAVFAWLELEPISGAKFVASERARYVLHEDGSAVAVPAGRWRVRLHAGGYRVPAPVEVELAAGDEHDLGAFALERAPVVAVEFVGVQPRIPTRIVFTEERGLAVASIAPQEESLHVRADLPARGFAIVDEPLDVSLERRFGGSYSFDAGWRSQTVAYEHDGGPRLELRLARWRAVEIRCPYAGPIEREAAVAVEIVDPRFEETWRQPVFFEGERDENARRSRRLFEGVPDEDARRFTDWLAPGAYVARARSLVLGEFEARIEVPAVGDEVVRVELKSVR